LSGQIAHLWDIYPLAYKQTKQADEPFAKLLNPEKFVA
jgi:hypothetical protein